MPSSIVPKRSDYVHVRDQYITRDVTLDGRPARIGGRLSAFALVWDRTDLARNARFSWDTVIRICEENDGAFRS